MLRLIILSVLTVGALSAPGGHNVVKKSGNVPAKFPMWHLEPLYIKKIPASNQEKRSVDSNSVSQVHQSHSVFTNVNGNQNSLTQQMEEVSKNGDLVSKVSQEEKGRAKAGHKPQVEKVTKVDIPQLNIHEQFMNHGGQEVRNNFVKRNVGLRLPSAEEMAKYILSTGDQQTVVQLIETMVEAGELSEEQALLYVETVKAILDTAEKELEEESLREMLLERKLEEAAMEERMEEEEAEREAVIRNLIQNGPKSPKRKPNQDLYKQLRGAW